jgi:NTP pyrophosphatase (non-canonical NTP hydrolase)
MEHKKWKAYNFGRSPGWHPLLGIVEEVGELSHAYLKREQKIRGAQAEHEAEMRDAVGDILLYLIDFCNIEKIDIEDTLLKTWGQVSKRDWKRNPKDAHLYKKQR